MKLDRYVEQRTYAPHHGRHWKIACRLVSADPVRCYNSERFVNRQLTYEQAFNMYQANDIRKMDTHKYVERCLV